ncbi:MAG: hypothetical protein MUF15_15295 [Acidobacteria bacterium]|jgi:hypothetical protein|nr:hypothetical protein [Acidobacteriota bacterium]
MNTNDISHKQRFIFFILIVFLLYPACRPKAVPFVIVREADFRVGVDLPLNEEGKKKLINFLIKGGDNQCSDIIIPEVPKAYNELFVLLSDSNFLYRSKFRKKGTVGKISKVLEPWFEKSIIYTLIDSQNQRPLIIAPICLQDKNKRYSWVFYMPQPPADIENDPLITRLLITLTPAKNDDKY